MTPKGTPHFNRVLCWAIVLLGVALKFWLIAELEISDAGDDPHEYVLQILHPDIGGLAYPPGTGLVGRLFYDLKIPFRLGTEALFMVASALVLRALLTWLSRSLLAALLFLFTLLNPNPAEEFSHLMSDQVWLVEMMAGLSCLVIALESRLPFRWALVGLAILLLGLTTVTRSTFVPLVVSLVLFIIPAILCLAGRGRSASYPNELGRFLAMAWAILFGIGFIYYGTCYYDWKRHGYFGISIIDSAEYRKFYTCLQSVGEPGDDTHFPIDQDRRKLIQQAGPTAQWFVEQVENNRVYKQVGIDLYGKPDVPAGWFHFATFNAVLPASQGDLRKAYARLALIEDEIAQAGREGRLKLRRVLTLPDSRLPVVWDALPAGIEHTTRAALYQPGSNAFTSNRGRLKFDSSEFARAVTRRAVTESPGREKAWTLLCTIYLGIYAAPLLFLFVASLAGFLITWSLKRGRSADERPLPFAAQQLFTIVFVVHFLWYALFDASGLSVFTRYLLFQNVMLPLLIASYLVVTVREGNLLSWRQKFEMPNRK